MTVFSKTPPQIARLFFRALSLFGFALTIPAQADELHVRTLNLKMGEMVYDASRERIWISVRASASENANSVIGLDPLSMEIAETIPVGPDPGALALSGDHRFLYIGLQGEPGYQRVDLNDQTVGPVHDVGGESSHSYYVADLAVLPDNPDAVAISRRRTGVLGGGNRGVAIYEAGVARSDQTELFTPTNEISFGNDSGMLFGFNTQNSGRDFFRLTVNENGVRVVDANRGFPAGTFSEGWFVGREGTVFDPHELKIIAGLDTRDTSSFHLGPGVVDGELKRIFRVTGRSLSIYETETFTLLRNIDIPGMTGTSVQLLRWGERGLAFRTDEDQLVVLDGTAIARDGPEADLRVELVTGPFSAIDGDELNYRIRVRNFGPDPAEAVALAHAIPVGFHLEQVLAERGDVIISDQAVEVRVESLAAEESIEATVRVTAQEAGRILLTATASSETHDPAPLNSTREAVVHVQQVHSPHRVLAEQLLLVEHLVAAPDRNTVYASININDPHHGNRVIEFNPETGTIVRTFFAGANPTRLAASADGTYLYAAVQNGRNLARIELATGEVDLAFSFGKQNDNQHRSASALLVLPGAPESVAVGMTAGGHGAGLAVFDDGIMRPDTGSHRAGPFVFDETGDRLFAFSGLLSEFMRFSVTETGIVPIDSTRNLLTGARHLEYAEGFVYTPGGRVIDTNSLTIHGTFPPAQAERVSVLPFPDGGRTLFLESNGLIEAFRTADFERMARWEVPYASQARQPLVKWGATGLAFAAGESLFFVESPLTVSDKVTFDVAIENPPIDMRMGMEWTYTIRMTNSGSAPATGLRIEQASTLFLNVNEVIVSRGAVSADSGSFEVLPGTLNPGEVLEVAVTIQPLLTRTYTPRVRIATVEADVNPSMREWLLSFTALRAGRLSVELPVEATEGDGVLEGGGSVSIAEAEAFDVQVQLTASLPERVSVPQVVTIPAGETAVAFDLGVIDDELLTGTQAVEVTAAASGYTSVSATIDIHDNEEFSLSLHLPHSAHQSESSAGEVRLDRVAHNAFPIELATEDGDWLALPHQVVIPSGSDRVQFQFSVADRPMPVEGRATSVRALAYDGTEASGQLLLLPPAPDSPVNPLPAAHRRFVGVAPVLAWNSVEPVELIVNGGFSTGDFRGWHRKSTGAGGWAINDGSFDPPGAAAPRPPFQGRYSAVSYQNEPGTNRLTQEIGIPYGAEQLRLSWMAGIQNGAPRFRTDSQEFRVEISGEATSTPQVVFRTHPGDPLVTEWEFYSQDISGNLEPRLRLDFVEIDHEGYLNVFLDSVSIIAEFPGITEMPEDIYDVYLGTSPEFQSGDLIASVDTPTLALDDLELGTTYYWQVIIRRGGQTVVGPVWSFRTAPVGVEIIAPEKPVMEAPLDFHILFSEPVAALSEDDFVIENGTGASISGEGGTYVLSVVPLHYGDVTVHLPGDAVHNEQGEGNAESTAKAFYGGAPSFDRWRDHYFTKEERGQSLEATDPLGDAGNAGVPNLLRYAFGMLDGKIDRSLLPHAIRLQHDEAESIGMVFYWQAKITDFGYEIELSEDLQTWSSADTQTEIVSVEDLGLRQRIVVRPLEEPAPDNRIFLRLRVSERDP